MSNVIDGGEIRYVKIESYEPLDEFVGLGDKEG